MTSVEIIALVLVVLSLIKFFFLLFNPRGWFDTIGKFWMKPGIATTLALVLGAIVLKYLLTELTIVQIFATFAFTATIFWLLMAPYIKDLFNAAQNFMMTGSIFRKNWLGILVWTLLMIWVLKDLFIK